MNRLLISLVLTINCIPLISQESILYNCKGQLRIDTSYSIDSILISNVIRIERNLYSIYRSIDYPEILAQNGIEGTVIANINVHGINSELSCDIVFSEFDELNGIVKDAVLSNQHYLLRYLDNEDPFEFYLPFRFEIDIRHFDQELKIHRTIYKQFHKVLKIVPL